MSLPRSIVLTSMWRLFIFVLKIFKQAGIILTFLINNLNENQEKEPNFNSEVAAAAGQIFQDGEKTKSAVEKTCANTNWQKFQRVVKEKGTCQKHPKRQLSHRGKSSTDNFKARKMYLPNVPTLSENGLLAGSTEDKNSRDNRELTKQIAMDCEMVGIGDGTESMIARVSLVNRNGACVYDKYVKPTEKVQDYRTPVSGIRPHHLEHGEEFKVVQSEVAEILRGRLLIGHALKNDLTVLFLSHPKRYLRDTSRYKPFRKVTMGNTPSLKKLAAELLGVNIQTGEHNSIEDARTAMQLYMLYKGQWEASIYNR